MVAGGDALGRIDDGRVALVDGALPGEHVRVDDHRGPADHLRAPRASRCLKAAPARVEPPCVHARKAAAAAAGSTSPSTRNRSSSSTSSATHFAGSRTSTTRPLRDTVAAPADGLPHDGARARRRRPPGVPEAPGARCRDDRQLPGRASARRRHAPARTLSGARRSHAARRYRDRRALRVHGSEGCIDPVADDVRTGPRRARARGDRRHAIRVSAQSFFQSRTDGAATLARLVREATGPDRVIADLYCGVGLFAVPADRPARVFAVERGRAAVADAKHNLKGATARIVRSDVGKWLGEQGRRRGRRPEPRRSRPGRCAGGVPVRHPSASCSCRVTRPRSRVTSACSSAAATTYGRSRSSTCSRTRRTSSA